MCFAPVAYKLYFSWPEKKALFIYLIWISLELILSRAGTILLMGFVMIKSSLHVIFDTIVYIYTFFFCRLGHSMWVSWWTKRNLGRFFLGFLLFCSATNFIPQFLHTHLSSFHHISSTPVMMHQAWLAGFLVIHRSSIKGLHGISSFDLTLFGHELRILGLLLFLCSNSYTITGYAMSKNVYVLLLSITSLSYSQYFVGST